MKTILSTWACLFFILSLPGQQSDMARQLFQLINAARTDPAAFMEKHGERVKVLKPAYHAYLLSRKPIAPAKWDAGLEAMTRSIVEEGNLDPQYEGEQDFCGYSGGRSSGNISKDPLEYVCRYYSNVHNPDYSAVGFYFNSSMRGFSLRWGIRCDREKIEFAFDEEMDFGAVDFDRLNTGKDAAYLSEVEKKMLMEVNFVRAYPKVYAKIIARHLADKSASYQGLNRDTHEAGMELIGELEIMDPAPILQPVECLYEVARAHGLDCETRGFIDHTGTDGSSPFTRIREGCDRPGNENLAGNSAENPRVPVISLLLDDGITSRGHRYNMLNKKWQYGVCVRFSLEAMGYGWVQNFAY